MQERRAHVPDKADLGPMANVRILRALSRFWPMPVARYKGKHGPLEVRWEFGRLVLNSRNANQSHGSLHRVWQVTLTRVLRGRPGPGSVLMLGFGAGSAASILRHGFGMGMPIIAVDDDPLVFDIARKHFGLDSLGSVELVTDDAFAFLRRDNRRHDLVLVDLFHDLDPAPVMSAEGLSDALLEACTPGGTVCINTVVHDERSLVVSQRMLRELRQAHAEVSELRVEDANRVLIATRRELPATGPKFDSPVADQD